MSGITGKPNNMIVDWILEVVQQDNSYTVLSFLHRYLTIFQDLI
ncbi:hypothetical protein ABES23_07330 [Peribacillus frigoritolerans]